MRAYGEQDRPEGGTQNPNQINGKGKGTRREGLELLRMSASRDIEMPCHAERRHTHAHTRTDTRHGSFQELKLLRRCFNFMKCNVMYRTVVLYCAFVKPVTTLRSRSPLPFYPRREKGDACHVEKPPNTLLHSHLPRRACLRVQ